MYDPPKESPGSQGDQQAPPPEPPPFAPDYDLITDMERSPRDDWSKRQQQSPTATR